MLRKLAVVTGVLALLGASTATLAQTKGPNGGMLAGSGHHKAELVVSPTELTVYLLEDGKPHDTKGTTLRAVVQEAGKPKTIRFADQGGKRLVGKLEAPLAKGTIVVVTGKDHHGDPINARYVIP
jgi:hypothetical protein